MPYIGNLIGVGSSKFSWAQYWASRLDTWHDGVKSASFLIPVAPTINSDADIFYKWDVFHADFARYNKVFAYNNDVLYLSYDAGYSYIKSISFTGAANIGMSYIFSNGNIIWATKNKIYLSTDDLTSYNEIIVKDINGSPWTPTGDGDNFKMLGVDRFVEIGGVEYLVFGNYGNTGGTTNQTNVFYTTDSGVNIKIAYKFGTSTPTLNTRHVHNVSFNQNDNSFWVQTGDVTNECHWLRGTHDITLDLWSWAVQGSGGDTSWFKTTGMYFDSSFVYWGSDVTGDTAKRTIWKAPLAGILDSGTYVSIYSNVAELSGNFRMNSSGEFICGITGSVNYKLIISKNSGASVLQKVITTPGGNAKYWRINQKNISGWWRMDAAALAEDSYSAGTMWVKIK